MEKEAIVPPHTQVLSDIQALIRSENPVETSEALIAVYQGFETCLRTIKTSIAPKQFVALQEYYNVLKPNISSSYASDNLTQKWMVVFQKHLQYLGLAILDDSNRENANLSSVEKQIKTSTYVMVIGTILYKEQYLAHSAENSTRIGIEVGGILTRPHEDTICSLLIGSADPKDCLPESLLKFKLFDMTSLEKYYDSFFSLASALLREDDTRTIKCLQQSFWKDQAPFLRYLGLCYMRGQGGTTKDLNKALICFQKSSEHGDIIAQYNLGLLYSNQEDISHALDWHNKAAAQGHVGAQYMLGALYEKIGPQQDNQKAFACYQGAAQQGHAGAQFALGNMIEEGKGIDPNPSQAIVYYTQAALQGHEQAQWALDQNNVAKIDEPKKVIAPERISASVTTQTDIESISDNALSTSAVRIAPASDMESQSKRHKTKHLDPHAQHVENFFDRIVQTVDLRRSSKQELRGAQFFGYPLTSAIYHLYVPSSWWIKTLYGTETWSIKRQESDNICFIVTHGDEGVGKFFDMLKQKQNHGDWQPLDCHQTPQPQSFEGFRHQDGQTLIGLMPCAAIDSIVPGLSGKKFYVCQKGAAYVSTKNEGTMQHPFDIINYYDVVQSYLKNFLDINTQSIQRLNKYAFFKNTQVAIMDEPDVKSQLQSIQKSSNPIMDYCRKHQAAPQWSLLMARYNQCCEDYAHLSQDLKTETLGRYLHIMSCILQHWKV